MRSPANRRTASSARRHGFARRVFAVERAGGRDQRVDVLGSREVRAPGLRDAEPASATARRVPVDVPVLDRDL
jgi:hypothetical protein